MENPDSSRFQMTKEHHSRTLGNALRENKVDPQLAGICAWFRESEHYFTSSGCAGRIVLLDIERENSKRDAWMHRKWHREVEWEEIMEGIREKGSGERWLKLDPFIVHVGCERMAHAEAVLRLMNQAGIKRGGIFSLREGGYRVELTGSHRMSLPVQKRDTLLAPEPYLSYVVSRMNEKLSMNYAKLSQFQQIIEEQL